jgi:hypothetical protein
LDTEAVTIPTPLVDDSGIHGTLISEMARRPKVDQLLAQVAQLELRVKLLESRVRASVSQARRPAAEQARLSRQARRRRANPRCPGCLLELPAGPRAKTCVWCGFRFEVARPITL